MPLGIEDPVITNQNNIDGFLHMLVAARDAKVKSFVCAASSSTCGDHPGLSKIEDKIGKALSPYVVTKLVNELYAESLPEITALKRLACAALTSSAVGETWMVPMLRSCQRGLPP